MDKKYKVTQKFMDELVEWQSTKNLYPSKENKFSNASSVDINCLPNIVQYWWYEHEATSIERNNRLIAIIQWLNGEDVFEVEEPHKFVVRSENTDVNGDYNYVKVVFKNLALVTDYNHAMRFDTREEAQEWANSHQVVVEIDEE